MTLPPERKAGEPWRRDEPPNEQVTDDLKMDYQPEVDLLFAWIGEPQAAENIEVESGVYVRVLPNARRVIGIEVLDCAARYHQKPEAIDATFAHRLIDQYGPVALSKARHAHSGGAVMAGS